jgi:8-oxo-dGTP pyrophosphatase MutT (NUDIX family)
MPEKFTNIEKTSGTTTEAKDTDVKFKGDYLKVVGYKNFEFVSEAHMVVVLPYLRDEGFILLRHEYVPTYQYFYKDSIDYKQITNFLTVLTGTVEQGETLENCVRRELYEETGIVLSNMYQIEMDKHLFLSKGNVSQYHTCLLEIRYNDYKVVQPKHDGSSEEELSKTIQISLGDLNEIKTHDLITEYMITKFKLEYNMK